MVCKYKLFDLKFSTYVKFQCHFPLCKYVGTCLQGHLQWKIGNVALKYCTHWSWCLFRALDDHSCLCKDRTADLAVQGTQRGQNFCFTQRQSTAKWHLHVKQSFLGIVDAWCCSHWVAHWFSLLHWENCLEESVLLLPQGRRSSWGRQWWLLKTFVPSAMLLYVAAASLVFHVVANQTGLLLAASLLLLTCSQCPPQGGALGRWTLPLAGQYS